MRKRDVSEATKNLNNFVNVEKELKVNIILYLI